MASPPPLALAEPATRRSPAPRPSASAPTVALLHDQDAPAWDHFVHAHPAGTFFHLAGWRDVMRRAFGHAGPFLLARRGGTITGVLPLVEIRSRLFGHALIGTAFCVGGGVLAADDESATLLLDAAERTARERGAGRIELRSPPPDRPGWVAASGLYFGFRKPLDPDPERNYAALRRKQRAVIRKGLDAGLKPELDDNVDRLHAVYAASVHRLGTPVFAKRYFTELQRTFGEDCEILTIVKGARAVASVMSFYFRDEVLPYYGGTLPEGRSIAASDVMYHELMRHAVARRGARRFDFGRSKAGTGAFDFKRHWGFTPEPLTYGFWLPDGGSPPEINPLNPKYRLFVELWKRQPLWLSKLAGPLIARQLG